MKRIHIHLTTGDLDKARDYYTTLFGQAPTLVHEDYLKWRLDDPAINLAVTPGHGSGQDTGVAHLGLDLEQPDDLSTLRERLGGAGYTELEEEGTHCCYAYSDKVWSQDGDGVVWEGFLTHGLAETRDGEPAEACCQPQPGDASSGAKSERNCCAG